MSRYTDVDEIPKYIRDLIYEPSINTRKQVTDYLLKRGFTQTEKIFRREASDLGPDGRPKHDTVEQTGPKKYSKSLILLSSWVENNLDVYKVTLLRLWPATVS